MDEKTLITVVSGVHPTEGERVVISWHGYRKDIAFALRPYLDPVSPRKNEHGWLWYTKPEDVSSVIKALAQVPNVTIHSGSESADTKPEEVDKVIHCERSGDTLVIWFDYHVDLYEAMQSVPASARSYSADTKKWYVRISHISFLIGVLKMRGADTSEIEVQQHQAPVFAQVKPDEKIKVSSKVLAQLRPYQLEGVRFLTRTIKQLRLDNPGSPNIKGVILSDDMGLGKSIQAAISANALAKPDETILVISPANAKIKWGTKEVRFATGEENPDVCIVDEKQMPKKARWIFINYDLLKKHYFDLVEIGFAVIIIDEAQYIANPGSQRSKLLTGGRVAVIKRATEYQDKRQVQQNLKGLCDAATRRVFVLTGTPIKNRMRDFFNLVRVIGHRYGANFAEFGQLFCEPKIVPIGAKVFDMKTKTWKQRTVTTYDGAANIEQFREDIRGCFLQRKKEDVAKDLPAKERIWSPVSCDLRAYKKAETAFRDRQTARILEIEDETERMKRLAAGPIPITTMSEMDQATSAAKVSATIEYVEEAVNNGHSVIIFCVYKDSVNSFMTHFGHNAVRYDGGTNSDDREKNVSLFMSGTVKVFVGNIDAAGTAIDLTVASVVVMHDLPYVPSDAFQAEDRAHRIGTVKSVLVNYMIAAGTIDEDKASIISEKSKTIDIFERGVPKELFEKLHQRLSTGPQNLAIKKHTAKKGKNK